MHSAHQLVELNDAVMHGLALMHGFVCLLRMTGYLLCIWCYLVRVLVVSLWYLVSVLVCFGV